MTIAKIFTNSLIDGRPATFTISDCQNAAMLLGVDHVSPSYQAFKTLFGSGRFPCDGTLEELFLFDPAGDNKNLLIWKMNDVIKNGFKISAESGIRQDQKIFELIYCGGDSGTFHLAWDPDDRNNYNENQYYEVDYDWHIPKKICYGLDEYLSNHWNPGWKFKPTFKAWDNG